MPIEVTEAGPCKRRIRVTIPPERIKAALAEGWRQAAHHAQIKGFRPGKVPRSILEKKYGTQVQDEVKQGLVNEAYREAITGHGLRPVEAPQLDLEALALDPARPLEFELTIEVRPELELPEWKGLEVGAPPVTVNDTDVDHELERLAAGHASLEPIQEGVAGKGDLLKAEVSYQVDGAMVIHRDEAVVDTRRDMVDGLPVDGGTGGFAGKEVGATVSVPVTLPPDFEPKGFAGAEALLLCTIKEIHRITLPAIDEAFAKRFGASDVATLREKLQEHVRRQREDERNRYVEERLLDQIVQKTPFELPQDLLERSVRDTVHRLEHQMTDAGVPASEARANAASRSGQIREDHERGLRATFVMDKIAEAERISVTENELEAAIRGLAAANGRGAQDLHDELYESGRLGSLRAQILEAKVRKVLRDSAKVTEAPTEPSSES